jgi:beta-glucosidase
MRSLIRGTLWRVAPVRRRLFCLLLGLLVALSACDASNGAGTATLPAPTATPVPTYLDATQPLPARVSDLVERMTLEEKIGQMTQVEKNSITPDDAGTYFIGSILSGGGGAPDDNSVAGWQAMTRAFQEAALSTRLGIPLLYGVDAVHGHGNLYGATIFPHQIGLGATRNPDLMRQIGQATAEEILATGVTWNFAPVVAVPQDIRWGRTYEAYGEDTALVTELGLAYMRGMQALPADLLPAPGQTLYTLATPKHYLGDGGTAFGSSEEGTYLLDQGDMRLAEETVRALFLPPYEVAVENGAMSIMPSYSSWNGTKMHAQTYWITDVLKSELGFPGFVVSDWGAIDQISFDYYEAVVTAINAGIDMNMTPFDYKVFINTMTRAVDSGDITMERVDDAVSRILTAKFALGLFDRPFGDPELAATVGSADHRALARQAVRESLVLLKNDNGALPLSKDTARIHVAGQAADDIGLQCGGWTITWQGTPGDNQAGTTILEGIRAASPGSEVLYDRSGEFEGAADIGIAVVGEFPYAEGAGDRSDLTLSRGDAALLERMRAQSQLLIVIIVSGRPLVITEQLSNADAWVAAWLPGSEGQGVADVLFGDYPFTGKLPFSWPRSMDQIPFDLADLPAQGCAAPLFPFGYGLDADEPGLPVQIDC